MINENPLVDLNAAFGDALLKQFFEPIVIGRSPEGLPYYAPSGVSHLAQSLYLQYGEKIREEVWSRINMDDLAGKIADLVVADLVKAPSIYSRNIHTEELSKRVKEIVAQQLGQRVVDQMDLQIGPKMIEEGSGNVGS